MDNAWHRKRKIYRGEENIFLSDNVEVETDIELEVSSFLTWQARQTRRDVVGGS